MESRQENLYSLEGAATRADLEEKIRSRTARVGVIGLGRVGLFLAVEMAKAGFQVTGIDIDMSRAESVNTANSYLADVPSEILERLVLKGRIKATQSLAAVENLDAVSVCVPIPLKTAAPDLSYVIAAVEAIHNHLHPGHLIIVESSAYQATAREVVLPILAKTGLQLGQDFFLAHASDSDSTMNGADPTRKISKRIVGMTTPCTELATLLYEQIFGEFSSSAAAETGTPPRNARHASAATVHDTTVSSRTFGIDILPAAEVVGQIRDQAPVLVVSGVMDALNEKQKSLKGSRILALGVACKRDTSHSRNSAAVEIMRGLHKKGALVYYSDPYVPSVKLDDCILKSQEMTPEILRAMDCVLILTDHSAFDYEMIAAHSFLILTRRNTLMDLSGSNVVRF